MSLKKITLISLLVLFLSSRIVLATENSNKTSVALTVLLIMGLSSGASLWWIYENHTKTPSTKPFPPADHEKVPQTTTPKTATKTLNDPGLLEGRNRNIVQGSPWVTGLLLSAIFFYKAYFYPQKFFHR